MKTYCASYANTYYNYKYFQGFNASYTTDDQTCGGIYDVTDELVAISSPALSSTDGELFNCRHVLLCNKKNYEFITQENHKSLR